jgi:hypothetical protein
LLPPPASPIESGSPDSWAAAEAALQTRLPADYKQFTQAYGTGSIDEFVTVLNASSTTARFRLDEYGETMLAVTRELRAVGIVEIPFPIYPEPGGLLPWGVTANGDWGYWITAPTGEPDAWEVAVSIDRGPEWFRHPGPLTRFLVDILDGSATVPFFPDDFPSSPPLFTRSARKGRAGFRRLGCRTDLSR